MRLINTWNKMCMLATFGFTLIWPI